VENQVQSTGGDLLQHKRFTILGRWLPRCVKIYLPTVQKYFHELIFLLCPEWIYSGAQATGVDYPIVNVNPKEWYLLEAYFTNTPNQFNLTIDSEGVSVWRVQRLSGAYIGFSVVTLALSGTNLVLAVIALIRHPSGKKRSIASVCLLLEILANLDRLFFGMDPFAPWRLWPYPVESTLFTMNIPLSLMSMVLLTLYWQELVDFSSLEISSVLSRSKIPAAIIGAVSVTLEVVNSGVRAAEVKFDLRTSRFFGFSLFLLVSYLWLTHPASCPYHKCYLLDCGHYLERPRWLRVNQRLQILPSAAAPQQEAEDAPKFQHKISGDTIWSCNAFHGCSDSPSRAEQHRRTFLRPLLRHYRIEHYRSHADYRLPKCIRFQKHAHKIVCRVNGRLLARIKVCSK
jgi:hypothetical protein